MADIRIYIFFVAVTSLLVTSWAKACSCGQCQQYQDRVDRCMCCRYYQVGGKRSVFDFSSQHILPTETQDPQTQRLLPEQVTEDSTILHLPDYRLQQLVSSGYLVPTAVYQSRNRPENEYITRPIFWNKPARTDSNFLSSLRSLSQDCPILPC